MLLLPNILTTLANSIFGKVTAWEPVQTIVEQPRMRPIRTGLHKEKIDSIAERIIILMEAEKLYQETELNLNQLAAKIGVPAYQVSQTINERMKRNFSDLINAYRVEEAKRLLLDEKNRNYTILSVGFEAGFNSKTTFNTVFKKFTGLTPTEYRDKQKQNAIRA